MTREELVEALTDSIIDGMDMNTLVAYAKEQLSGYYDKLSLEELETEADNFAPHLLD